jgi:hypothetical protein
MSSAQEEITRDHKRTRESTTQQRGEQIRSKPTTTTTNTERMRSEKKAKQIKAKQIKHAFMRVQTLTQARKSLRACSGDSREGLQEQTERSPFVPMLRRTDGISWNMRASSGMRESDGRSGSAISLRRTNISGYCLPNEPRHTMSSQSCIRTAEASACS